MHQRDFLTRSGIMTPSLERIGPVHLSMFEVAHFCQSVRQSKSLDEIWSQTFDFAGFDPGAVMKLNLEILACPQVKQWLSWPSQAPLQVS